MCNCHATIKSSKISISNVDSHPHQLLKRSVSWENCIVPPFACLQATVSSALGFKTAGVSIQTLEVGKQNSCAQGIRNTVNLSHRKDYPGLCSIAHVCNPSSLPPTQITHTAPSHPPALSMQAHPRCLYELLGRKWPVFFYLLKVEFHITQAGFKLCVT